MSTRRTRARSRGGTWTGGYWRHVTLSLFVPVEEDQLLLPQHNEDGVHQLGQLGQHEQPGPERGHVILTQPV